jgi:hypothetical protein
MWWWLRNRPGGVSKETSVAFARWCAERAKAHDDDYATADAAYWAASAAAADARDAADSAAYAAAATTAATAAAQAEWIRANVGAP